MTCPKVSWIYSRAEMCYRAAQQRLYISRRTVVTYLASGRDSTRLIAWLIHPELVLAIARSRVTENQVVRTFRHCALIDCMLAILHTDLYPTVLKCSMIGMNECVVEEKKSRSHEANCRVYPIVGTRTTEAGAWSELHLIHAIPLNLHPSARTIVKQHDSPASRPKWQTQPQKPP
jgi:hypothetical protein